MPDIVTIKTINLEGIGSFQLVEVGPDQWCWQTPGFQWKFNERISPPLANVAMYTDGKFDYKLRVSRVEFALCYTMGFAFGYKNGIQHADEDALEKAKTAFGKSFENDPNRPPIKADDGINPTDPGSGSVP